jgi:transposase
MDRYIGLDVHSQSCTLAVEDARGKRLSEQVLETNGTVLVRCLSGIAGTKHLCFEEGTQSAWLYEVLEPHVDEVVVVQPEKRHGNKSDSIDAWALAERLRTGVKTGRVYKAPRRFSELRQAVHGYEMATQDLVRAKNRLRAVFRAHGMTVTMTRAAFEDPDQRAAQIDKLPKAPRHLAEQLSERLDSAVEARASAESWLREQGARLPEATRLATAPGIGEIRAAQIVAVVVSPERFRARRQFWSYCGLGVVTRTSADWVKDPTTGKWKQKDATTTRGLNRHRNPLLKNVFKGAAMTVINSLPNHPLHADYARQLEAGIKPNLARLTLARRIASMALAMWKAKEDYDPTRQRPQSSA